MIIEEKELAPCRTESGGYFVSKTGEVYSSITGRWLAVLRSPSGYCYVRIGDGKGKSISKYVHRLVFDSWVRPLAKGEQINHLDGDKSRNHVGNLEPCSGSRNILHSIRHLGRKPFVEKLSRFEAGEIKLLLFYGGSCNAIAKLYPPVTAGTISCIKLGKTWKNWL